MRKLVVALGLVVVALAGVLLTRTLTFGSRQAVVEPAPRSAVDERQVAERLAGAVRIPTISDARPLEERAVAFIAFLDYLATTFPRVHEALSRLPVEDLSVLYTWRGMNPSLPPVILMGHMDVVPVDSGTEDRWTQPPFAGRIADGFIWGRGTLDDKVNVLGLLEAVESLLGEGFAPERTVYLSFGHDEELSGTGAAAIARHLQGEGVQPFFVLDEGGFIATDLVPGLTSPVALIGIAEKGYLSLELTVEAAGGHSSMPPTESAVGILSRALDRLERHPFPLALGGVTREMFLTLGPELPFLQRMTFANLWLFEPVVTRRVGRTPSGAAMLRTTTAPTMLRAGTKDNVLPGIASGVVNFRILPGQTISQVTSRVREIIGDPRVTVRALADATEPSPVSRVGDAAYRALERTIREIFPGTVVTPYLMVAATDARSFTSLASDVFRFTPVRMGPEDLEREHGTDERLAVEDYADVVRFYLRLIRNTTAIRVTEVG